MAIDPFGKGGKITAPRFESSVVIYTQPKAKNGHNLAGNPLTFSTPGEYEVKGISCIGFESPDTTPFFIEWEGMKLFHLGGARDSDLMEHVSDAVGTIDILFVSPTGSGSQAQKVISTIDPRVVVVIKDSSIKKADFESFMKDMREKPEILSKISIKKKGLPTEGQRLLVLEPEHS
jgi:hypothetical protein